MTSPAAESASVEVEVEVVLLDIEGTVCPISFVKDVLFPYALNALNTVEWDSPSFAPYRDAFPEEYRTTSEAFKSHIQDLMMRDVKVAYLKNLQGYLWLQGYESGDLKCPLFDDVYPAFKAWKEKGLKIVIYSSGSVAAQQLLFQYTNTEAKSDLRSFLSGYFDTVNAGLKADSTSYDKIAASIYNEAGELFEKSKWLFLSDRAPEVDAAIAAGMQALVVVREGNASLSEDDEDLHLCIQSFDEIEIVDAESS